MGICFVFLGKEKEYRMIDSAHEANLKGFAVEDVLRRILYATGISTQSQLAEQLGVRRAGHQKHS